METMPQRVSLYSYFSASSTRDLTAVRCARRSLVLLYYGTATIRRPPARSIEPRDDERSRIYVIRESAVLVFDRDRLTICCRTFRVEVNDFYVGDGFSTGLVAVYSTWVARGILDFLE